jgi:hypothetical protein
VDRRTASSTSRRAGRPHGVRPCSIRRTRLMRSSSAP